MCIRDRFTLDTLGAILAGCTLVAVLAAQTFISGETLGTFVTNGTLELRDDGLDSLEELLADVRVDLRVALLRAVGGGQVASVQELQGDKVEGTWCDS